ncbi:MAG: glutathione binding-like protein [Planctomycetota bacterium]
MLLYYTPGTCALGAMALLRHTELPFQLCRVAREARQGPVFRTINPHGHVPALATDDDRVIWENSAVLVHVARRAGGSLMPAPGSPGEDELNQWFSYLGSEFHAAFYPIFKPQLFLRDASMHDDLRRDAIKNVKRHLAFVDGHLESRRFVATDQFGVLDPYLFAMARWGERFCEYAKEFPSLGRFQERMRSHPAIEFALAIEGGDDVPTGGGYGGHVDLLPR